MKADEAEGAVRPEEKPMARGQDFVRAMVADDVTEGRFDSRVVTRFPPEPNGFLHIGHAKSICLNFGIAAEFGGSCHLRFDDTNPETEDVKYVRAIEEDVRWLGFDWHEHLYFASDYFERFYDLAVGLVRRGLAYVDSQNEEEIRERRGTVMEPGTASPYRGRTPEENLDLFARMRAGEFADGAHVLRAKIDMASPNMLMRDPLLYRIRHASHYRQGERWCIYPLYDYAHPLEDAIECVTHSLCTLEFENNRELYDWVVENTGVGCRPEQTEFARLALDYTVMSKRRLLELVRNRDVHGWDDPRMPTIAGLRRRGVTPEAIRAFCDMIGVAKSDSRVDIAKLEYAIRDDLNHRAPRVMCVLRPLRVVLTNYPEDRVESFDAPYYPRDVTKEGSRAIPFSRELFIDREDFREDPPPGFFRLSPGSEVRLRYAYVIRCDEVVKDAGGEVVELRCTYDPETAGGSTPGGRTVRGTLHWVSAAHALPAEVRLYDRLFRVPEPGSDPDGADFRTFLNPDSLLTIGDARIEPSVADEPSGSHYQFERLGYFASDAVDSRPGHLVYNRTVTLRDTWARIEQGDGESSGRPERRKPAAGDGKSRPRRTAPRPAAEESSPELLDARLRYQYELSLSEEDAKLLSRDAGTAALFDAAIATGAPAQSVANWVINELPRELREREISELPFGGTELGSLVSMVEDGTINGGAARDVLAEMAQSGGVPAAIVERKGLRQVSDPDALRPIVTAVIAEHPDRVAAYHGGRTGLLGFFVGQVMSRSDGRANPELVKQLVTEALAQP